MPATATAFPLRLRLHYKAARAGGVTFYVGWTAMSISSLVVKILCFAACLLAPFTDGKVNAETLIDQGEVCFSSKHYNGWITIGCVSSSCTFQTEREVSVEVDSKNRIINISSRVVLGERTDEEKEEMPFCTDDCGGVSFTFDFSGFRLAGKKYTVVYGSKTMGTLDTDFDTDAAFDRPVCFGNQYPINER